MDIPSFGELALKLGIPSAFAIVLLAFVLKSARELVMVLFERVINTLEKVADKLDAIHERLTVLEITAGGHHRRPRAAGSKGGQLTSSGTAAVPTGTSSGTTTSGGDRTDG